MKRNKILSLKQAPEELKNLLNSSKQGNYESFFNYCMEAGASLEHVKVLSTLLAREVESKKDTEDYNFSVVSEIIDKAVSVLTEAGVESVNPGEIIRLTCELAKELNLANLVEDYEESKKNKDYKFRYSAQVESELRQMFFLKTSKSDSYPSLMAEMDKVSEKYISASDWNLLKGIIKKSEKRLKKEKIKFLQPMKDFEVGELKKLSEFEANTLNLKGDVMYDERSDYHDLLAMKELLKIMQGESVHPLSIALGFFAKYMPEVIKEGYEGIILKVTKDKLVEIKLSKLPKKGIDYSPAEASTLFYTNYMINQADEKLEVNNSVFIDTKYYILVDGAVAIPSAMVPYQYEQFSKNDDVVKAGEVFLLEKISSEFVLTRLYFTPYSYSKLHIMHQHGSVIFGGNDQSFQSVFKDRKISHDAIINQFKDWWRETGGGGSESVTSARMFSELKDKFPEDIFKEKYLKILTDVMHSVTDVNEFTLEYELSTFMLLMRREYSGVHLKNIYDLSKNYAPLSRRWLLAQYLKDGSGLTKESQLTMFRELAQAYRADSGLKLIAALNPDKMEQEKESINVTASSLDQALANLKNKQK